MAITKTVSLDVQTNLDETTKSVGSLKAQLREAQAEVAALSDKFGATSKEAVEAAKRAAELKDRIGDAKTLTEAFNPDAKFAALTNSLSGVAGGFSAVTGAMGLLGSESAEVEQMILKVQSAMAISQGIQAVGESIDSFKQLGAVIKSATVFQKLNSAATTVAATVQKLFTGAVNTTAVSFNALKAAIVSTGIGALVVGLGFLISKLMASSDATKELTDKQKLLNEELEYTKELSEDNAKTIDYNTKTAIASAKQRGASEKELLKIQLDALEKKGKANAAEYEKIKSSQDKEYNLTKEQTKRLQELREQNIGLQREGNLLIAEINASAAEKARQENQKNADAAASKNKADREKQIAEEKARREKELQDLKDFQKIIRDAEAEDGAAKVSERLSREQSTIDSLNAIADEQDRIEEENLRKRQEAADKELEIERLKQQGKVVLAQKTSELLGTFSDLLGKQTAEGKALAIAQATINAYLGISEVWKAKNVYPEPFGTATKIASTVVIAASAFKTVKDIAAVQVPGGGGGGAGSAPAAGGAAPAAPSFNVVGNSGTNQLAQVMNQQGMPPVQAFVVASNVTSAQSLNRNIVNNATLG
jgi:hypothetical protein